MVKRNALSLIFLVVFFLGVMGPGVKANAPYPVPNPGEWSGTTGSGKDVSFDVISSGTQWYMFAFTFSWYGAYISGTTTITTYGPGSIALGLFGYSGGTYSFSGSFTNKSSAVGLYALDSYKIILPNGYVLVTGGGTWTAAGPASAPDPGPPFGSFDSPIDGSTVSSSIPVTGWALDDNGIDSVKIYRKEGNGMAYIGDAILVEGARPDVAAAYPQYPGKTKAGWGYMMLTNFLPNGGNGTFTIYAIATDSLANSTTLGSKTIYCDNAHAVKPFGAIDTPAQGGSASGSGFLNWGWVLTPQPNSIPTDGSSINVYVDGVKLGSPHYNIYRSDIASLFPGYANSNGAVGYYSLDTTKYANGVHTISWTVRDSGNNTDGIGSRYFSINNNSSSSSLDSATQNTRVTTVFNDLCPSDKLAGFSPLPVEFKTGFQEDGESLFSSPDASGTARIETKELDRLEIRLADPAYGYMMVDNKFYPLPIGSTLDLNTGKFYWIPGVGFIGDYRLVFAEKRPDGKLDRRDILVTIVPKFSPEKTINREHHQE